MESRLLYIGNGFWNLRASLVFVGIIDIGNQMSLIKLSSGKFLVIDTCEISDSDQKRIDDLTNNGDLIEAVIATHPFHTLYFEPFYRKYPKALYYGTPRHLVKQKSIPWAGNVSSPEILRQYESEGIFMRIPNGGEIAFQGDTSESNHFTGLFVYHAPSSTLFIDDTIMYYENVGCALCCIGKRAGVMEFWDLAGGLNPDAAAPRQFKEFIEGVLRDWNFDNICTAHTGIKLGGAKELLEQTLKVSESSLLSLTKQRGGRMW